MWFTNMDKQISNIIFTKNRPLQLEGYLESLYRCFPIELIQTYIIYKPELFNDEYQQLFEKYSDCVVIRETDFSVDFFSVLNRVDTKYILFGIDDVVYFDSAYLDVINETFDRFPVDIFGFSLRLGEQLINKGNDPVKENNVAGQTVYSINWLQGRTPTTRYPFELCATIYKSELVRKIIKSSRKNNNLCENLFAPNSRVVRILSKIIKRHKLLKKFGYFYNPNTLESWNCRWCQRQAEWLPPRLYFQKQCAVAIQANMVNTSTRTTSEGSIEHTVETLNEKYKQGYRLNIDYVAKNKPINTHCGSELLDLVMVRER